MATTTSVGIAGMGQAVGRAPTMTEQPMPNAAIPSVLWSLRVLVRSGRRTILVTTTPTDDRGASFHAPVGWNESQVGCGFGGLVGTAEALAAEGHRVVVVQVGPAPPDSPGARPGRGLWELLHESYSCELVECRTRRFGLGDWLEILGTQGRTGELLVHEGDELFRFRLAQGMIRGFECPSHEGDHQLPEKALLARVRENIVRRLDRPHPEFGFIGDPDAPRTAGREEESDLDGLFRRRLGDRMAYPYLTDRIEAHVTETALPHLRLLAAGARPILLNSLRRPLGFLLDRLSRSFGVVLIDALLATGATAEMLAGLTDSVVLVARREGIRSAGVRRAVEELRRRGATMIAVDAV